MSKSQAYSPSMNYNYNGNQAQHGNHGNHSTHGNHGNSGFNNQQNQRRKPNQFKRDNHGVNDRLVKQNDIIIRLLKEIRDRLPEPPVVETDAEVGENETAEATAVENPETAEEETEEQGTEEDVPVAAAGTQGYIEDDDLDTKVNGNI